MANTPELLRNTASLLQRRINLGQAPQMRMNFTQGRQMEPPSASPSPLERQDFNMMGSQASSPMVGAQSQHMAPVSFSSSEERAYVSASERRDGTLEDRVGTAEMASHVDKNRTVKGFRRSAEIVRNGEIYHEEDDIAPHLYAHYSQQAPIWRGAGMAPGAIPPSSYGQYGVPLQQQTQQQPVLLDAPSFMSTNQLNFNFNQNTMLEHFSNMSDAQTDEQQSPGGAEFVFPASQPESLKYEPRPTRFDEGYDNSNEITIKPKRNNKPALAGFFPDEHQQTQADNSQKTLLRPQPPGLQHSLAGSFGPEQASPLQPSFESRMVFNGNEFDNADLRRRPSMVSSQSGSRKGHKHSDSQASQVSALSIQDLNVEECKIESGVSPDDIEDLIEGPDNNNSYKCLVEGCNKQFGRKENVKSHVQTHLGDRQYQCSRCRKKFVRSHDLTRHYKTHTGVKPYECSCGASFIRQDALGRHRWRNNCEGGISRPGRTKEKKKRGRPTKEEAAMKARMGKAKMQRPDMETRVDKANRTREKNAAPSPSPTCSESQSGYSYGSAAGSPAAEDNPFARGFGDAMASASSPPMIEPMATTASMDPSALNLSWLQLQNGNPRAGVSHTSFANSVEDVPSPAAMSRQHSQLSQLSRSSSISLAHVDFEMSPGSQQSRFSRYGSFASSSPVIVMSQPSPPFSEANHGTPDLLRSGSSPLSHEPVPDFNNNGVSYIGPSLAARPSDSCESNFSQTFDPMGLSPSPQLEEPDLPMLPCFKSSEEDEFLDLYTASDDVPYCSDALDGDQLNFTNFDSYSQ